MLFALFLLGTNLPSIATIVTWETTFKLNISLDYLLEIASNVTTLPVLFILIGEKNV